MNKLPERGPIAAGDAKPELMTEDYNFEADLVREDRIQSEADLSRDRALGADQALKKRLGQIETPPLPDALRNAVMQSDRRREGPMAWLAMAAAVVLSVIVISALDPFGANDQSQKITEQDWAQLTLAIETLNTQGQQIARVTQRQVSPHLSLPELELPRLQMQIEPLPYPDSFRRWFQPRIPQTH